MKHYSPLVMKNAKTILIVVLCLISAFFVVYANIQTNLAKEYKEQSTNLAQDAAALQKVAEQQAVNAREAEAKARAAQAEAERIMEELMECKSSK